MCHVRANDPLQNMSMHTEKQRSYCHVARKKHWSILMRPGIIQNQEMHFPFLCSLPGFCPISQITKSTTPIRIHQPPP